MERRNAWGRTDGIAVHWEALVLSVTTPVDPPKIKLVVSEAPNSLQIAHDKHTHNDHFGE